MPVRCYAMDAWWGDWSWRSWDGWEGGWWNDWDEWWKRGGWHSAGWKEWSGGGWDAWRDGGWDAEVKQLQQEQQQQQQPPPAKEPPARPTPTGVAWLVLAEGSLGMQLHDGLVLPTDAGCVPGMHVFTVQDVVRLPV